MDLLFPSAAAGRPSAAEVAARGAASKLANNAALLVQELAREPCGGLRHVVAHIQQSVPVLLETHHQLEAATVQLQAVLAELHDAQEGLLSITSPTTQQDLAQLARSLDGAQHVLQAQQDAAEAQAAAAADQQQQQQQQEQPEAGAGAALPRPAGRLASSLKLWGGGGSSGALGGG